MHFRNRSDAGRELAAALGSYRGKPDVLLLALPRGGVPVAAEVAQALHLPLDVILVRKLGMPGNEELAIGAIAFGDICVLNHGLIAQMNIPEAEIDRTISEQQTELKRRNDLYRAGRPAPDLRGKTVILIDDGLATGATMQAAVAALRKAGAPHIIVAVPVGATDSCAELQSRVDSVVCPFQPSPFMGVGRWYDDFTQTTDAEVQKLLTLYGEQQDEKRSTPGTGM